VKRKPAQWLVLAWAPLALSATIAGSEGEALAAERGTALSRRILDKREQLKQLTNELDRRRKQATRVAQRERQLFEDLDRADRQLEQKGRELRTLQDKFRARSERLQVLQREIKLTQAELDRLQNLFRRRVRAIYKQGRSGYIRALLSAEDLSHGIRRTKFLAAIANQDKRMVAMYTTALTSLEEKQDALERSKRELVESQKAVSAKREEILKEQRDKRRLLAMVQEQKRNHLAAIRQLELGAKELQGLIGRLQGEARIQRGRRPGQDSQPGTAISKERGSFAALKGRLPWPTSGSLAAPFGRQVHPRYGTVTFNRGIEINAPEKQQIVAVSDGSVLFADWFKGYGRLVIVDHGDGYYTVYAHAAEIRVKVGDLVTRGQPIGLVGDSGSASGSQLYFEVRHRGRPQDPIAWLSPH
jgi:septal ring factor EnvC (AmiA/AmiB activator)